MLIFYLFFLIIAIQRLCELIIAKRNERWMKSRGAIEFGQEHYRLIVTVHAMFFVVYFLEVTAWQTKLSVLWPVLLSLFIVTQIIRIWALTSLGHYWNTKIIVLPQATIVKKGPYRFLKHPNYLVVTIEFIIIPMLFEAYFTAFLFTILNGIILSIRIPAEEKALNELTEYQVSLLTKKRFKLKKV
jgi:methyltransferase